jgi:hypothetical protein
LHACCVVLVEQRWFRLRFCGLLLSPRVRRQRTREVFVIGGRRSLLS